jgi:hypothetical protein
MNITWVWVVSICGFLFSIINFILGKYITSKLVENDLMHLEKDVKELKTGEKEYRTDLKKELNKIFKRLGKIEKEIIRRETICNERHSQKR